MNIRTYQPGDEAAQAEIYNEAGADLPKFKPATVDEVSRRCRAADFDPASRFYAVDGQGVLGYSTFQVNGRISYPWCRKGAEAAAEPLCQATLQAMRDRGMRSAFAAYRGDWPAQQSFFLDRGFRAAREMINFLLDLADLPTMTAHPNTTVAPLRPEDIPAIRELAPQALRTADTRELEKSLLHNPYFNPDSVFVLRSRKNGPIVVAGVLIYNESYADPENVDSAMPCFRLGAFGTEGMQTKRINGLFSFLAKDDLDLRPLGLACLDQAVYRLEKTEVGTLAAQVPSDVPHLVAFYKGFFRRQGSFPVLERQL